MIFCLATLADVPSLANMRWEYNTDGAAPVGEQYEDFVKYRSDFLERALAERQMGHDYGAGYRLNVYLSASLPAGAAARLV